jgi:hypothetical protein
MFSLFDDAMGGDFEGADRGVEYDRASRIGDCHADLILELRRLRRDVLTLRYVLRSMLPIGKKIG